MISTGEQRQIILVPLLEGAVNLVASLIAGYYWGAIGVAFGTLIGSFFSIGGHIVYTMRRSVAIELRVSDYFRDSLLRPIMCALPFQRLKRVLKPESVIVVVLPNVVWWRQRIQFLLGRWRYQDWGILDETHFRFFDRESAEQLLEDSGYKILKRRFDGPFPLINPVRGLIGRWATKIDRATSTCVPGLLAFQFAFVARPRGAQSGSGTSSKTIEKDDKGRE